MCLSFRCSRSHSDYLGLDILSLVGKSYVTSVPPTRTRWSQCPFLAEKYLLNTEDVNRALTPWVISKKLQIRTIQIDLNDISTDRITLYISVVCSVRVEACSSILEITVLQVRLFLTAVEQPTPHPHPPAPRHCFVLSVIYVYLQQGCMMLHRWLYFWQE